MHYVLRQEGYDTNLEATSRYEAEQEVEEMLRNGSYEPEERTFWVKGHLLMVELDEFGNEVETFLDTLRISIHPDEPKCNPVQPEEDAPASDPVSTQGHCWGAPHRLVGGNKENPGVWGYRGGVRLMRVCLRCGCAEYVNTWAEDPETGEEGLVSISYERSAFEAQLRDEYQESKKKEEGEP